MGLPLYLALTAAEMCACAEIPKRFAWMACHFSPCSEGLTNIPASVPEGSILILNDRIPCGGHSASVAAAQIREAVSRLGCESVLLDFQRPPEPESLQMAEAIVHALRCSVALSEKYAKNLSCAVFLPPNPLHIPLAQHLAPWQGREIWLEAALCQEAVHVTATGATFSPQFPPEGKSGGHYDESLCCCYQSRIQSHEIVFTLYDTVDSLQKKLALAHELGVARAVGLYQELGHK